MGQKLDPGQPADGSRGGAGHHPESAHVAGGGGWPAPLLLVPVLAGGQGWCEAPSPPPKLKNTGNDDDPVAAGAVGSKKRGGSPAPCRNRAYSEYSPPPAPAASACDSSSASGLCGGVANAAPYSAHTTRAVKKQTFPVLKDYVFTLLLII